MKRNEELMSQIPTMVDLLVLLPSALFRSLIYMYVPLLLFPIYTIAVIITLLIYIWHVRNKNLELHAWIIFLTHVYFYSKKKKWHTFFIICQLINNKYHKMYK